jgi:uncharacterized membrane protein
MNPHTLTTILSYAEPFLATFLLWYFMRRLLPSRLNNVGLVSLALIYTLWYNLRSIELFGTNYHFWMNIFINALTWGTIIFLYKGKFYRKLLIWWYFELTKATCQAIAYVPFMLYRGLGAEWVTVIAAVDGGALPKLLHTLLYLALFLLLGFLSLPIWRHILLQKLSPYYLIIIAFPLGQMYFMSDVVRPNMGDWFFGIAYAFVGDVEAAYSLLSLGGLSVSIAASAALLAYVFSYEKKAAAEATLRAANHEMALDHTEYQAMAQTRADMEKICHDFNNQLTSILQLARMGEDEAVKEMLAELKSEIADERLGR